MLILIIAKIQHFLKNGHQRTIVAKRNILFSLIIKSISMVINLLMVPITINYINPTQYGVWLTLSSIIGWLSFFDIGFGNGLRNNFAIAKASNNYYEARVYISTTYAVLAIIFFCVWILFFFLNLVINWTDLINIPTSMGTEIASLALIVCSFFCIQMVLKIINTILIADQKPAKSALFDMFGQLIALIIIFILTKTTKGSLIYLGLSIGFAPVIILILSSIYLYSSSYKFLSPSFKYVKFSYAKDVLDIGYKFFLIQIAVIVIYETNNIIIAQVGTPLDVTLFNVAYKYIGIALMFFVIILSPFWSAFTEAYSKKDYVWMKNTVQNLRYISYSVIIVLPIFVFFSDFVYAKWIGNSMIIPLEITIIVSVYIAFMILISLNTQILNGIGKIKIQLFTYTLATIFHIPLALFLGNKFGTIGVISSAIFFYTIVLIFSVIQVNLLVSNEAKGIWNK